MNNLLHKRFLKAVSIQFYLLFFLAPVSFYCNKDSLLKVLQNAKDTTRITTLIRLASVQLTQGDKDGAEQSLIQAKKSNELIKDSLLNGRIELRWATLDYRKGEFKSAYNRCKVILPYFIRNKNLVLSNECKINLGMCIGRMGDFRSALEYYHDVLPYYEKQKDERPKIRLYSNIAGVYFDQLDYNMAIEYFNKSLQISLYLKDFKTIGQSYNNIGSALQNMGKNKEAKQYYLKAVPINKYAKNYHNLAYNYMNIASCEYFEGDIESAIEHNTESLRILRELEDPYAIASCLNLQAEILIAQNKFIEAKKIMEESVKLSEQTGSPVLAEKTYKQMADVYKSTGDFANSMHFLYKFITTRDSIINENIREQVTKKKIAYEFEKQRLADSLASAAIELRLNEQIAFSNKETQLQRSISLVSILSLVLMAALSFFIYRGYKRNKAASQTIEEQKKIVELKNKEITDSMHYAKTIQYNLMAQRSFIDKYFPQNFILFKPKDIVSGDFFWAGEKSDLVFIASCDSTGHGVPGAFMSLLNIGFMNEAVKEKNITKPNEIFNYVRERLLEAFVQEGQKDGMDGIIVCLDRKSKKMTYAAANNVPVLVRNGRAGYLENDKMPVGKGERTESFTLYELDLKAGDTLYLYTDGFADQFGGPKGKKYMYKNLNQKLQEISVYDTLKQMNELNIEFDSWKGRLEQVDDVCIIGIKI